MECYTSSKSLVESGAGAFLKIHRGCDDLSASALSITPNSFLVPVKQ
jgi:hypothetical protein